MNASAVKRLFWNKKFPLSSLSGGALLIIASDRLAHAIVVLAALVWTYALVRLALFGAERFFPKKGRSILLAFLASFITGLFFFLLWLFSPFLAMQTFFVIPFILILCVSLEADNKNQARGLQGLKEGMVVSVTNALVYGALPVIFALIREPFGFLSLSLPGGAQGIIHLFLFEDRQYFPFRLIASSSGALLLLGYVMGLYRHYKKIYASEEEKEDG